MGVRTADYEFLDEFQARGYRLAEEGVPLRAPFSGPSLLIGGRHDTMVGYRTLLAKDVESMRGTVAVLDGGGHVVQFERARLVTVLVEDWLDRMEAEG